MKGYPANMNSNRQNYSSNAPWEEKAAYSRAVKIDKQIFVSGTTATDENGNVA